MLLQMSVGSEMTGLSQLGAQDDSSNDALVIVDDAHNSFPPGEDNGPDVAVNS